ncbi:hypothetical protein MCERE19_01192 [Spirosomataceae bacterium]
MVKHNFIQKYHIVKKLWTLIILKPITFFLQYFYTYLISLAPFIPAGINSKFSRNRYAKVLLIYPCLHYTFNLTEI